MAEDPHPRANEAHSVAEKRDVVRVAAQHDYPVGDRDEMLAEIESGYGSGAPPNVAV